MGQTYRKEDWDKVIDFFDRNFRTGPSPSMHEIFYLIGVQELGQGFKNFSRDDKINLMHAGLCAALETLGYCRRKKNLPGGWPDFDILRPLPAENEPEYEELIKKAIIGYLKKEGIL